MFYHMFPSSPMFYPWCFYCCLCVFPSSDSQILLYVPMFSLCYQCVSHMFPCFPKILHGFPYGGFLKWGYPPIIYFKKILHYKPSILGYPHLWNPPDFPLCFPPFREDSHVDVSPLAQPATAPAMVPPVDLCTVQEFAASFCLGETVVEIGKINHQQIGISCNFM